MPGVSIKGDSARLNGLIATLKDFAGSGPLSTLSKELAEESLYLIRQGFRKEQDPYGNDWAPLKHRKGRILRDTGRLANSFGRVRANRNGFVVGSNVDYSSVHQGGASYTARPGMTSRYKGRFVSNQRLTKRGVKKRGGLKKGYSVRSHGAHQVEIPSRMMLPSESMGLGPHWESAFARVAKRTMSRLLKRKR